VPRRHVVTQLVGEAVVPGGAGPVGDRERGVLRGIQVAQTAGDAVLDDQSDLVGTVRLSRRVDVVEEAVGQVLEPAQVGREVVRGVTRVSSVWTRVRRCVSPR